MNLTLALRGDRLLDRSARPEKGRRRQIGFIAMICFTVGIEKRPSVQAGDEPWDRQQYDRATWQRLDADRFTALCFNTRAKTEKVTSLRRALHPRSEEQCRSSSAP